MDELVLKEGVINCGRGGVVNLSHTDSADEMQLNLILRPC